MSPLSRDPDRDARHLALPDFGEAELSKLQQAIVVVIGAGGLGAPVLTYLAASGVGTLRIVDDDVVEASNLVRQVLFRPADLGQSKAHLAGRRVGEINPDVHWEAYSTRFTADNGLALLDQADLVVDCSDNPPTRYLIQASARHLGIPVVWGAVGEYAGRCSVVLPHRGPCLACLFGPEETWPPPTTNAIFSPVCALVGALITSEALKLLTGIGTPLVGRLAQVDTLSGDLMCIEVAPDPNCTACC